MVGNRAPMALGTLPDRTLPIADGGVSVDVAGAFQDLDNDALTYGANSSEASVATALAAWSTVTALLRATLSLDPAAGVPADADGPWKGPGGHQRVDRRARQRGSAHDLAEVKQLRRGDIRVSRTRVLRVMRAQGLLSPHRGRQGEMKAHDGTIVTSAPDVMWGIDGVRVFTADDGWVWTFAAVEHWNAECVGWHVCKVGSRFAALEPIAQGLGRLYGSVEADVARGLALRMDHGSQYLSDHFLNQLRYWGIHPSFGFVEEPETNGVVERWNRTLKEQAVYGRVFRNLAEVRAAVAEFVVRYNQCWRLEKLAYRTPLEAREEYELRQAA